jgi:hypothetical protein
MENERKSSIKIGVAHSPSTSVMAVDPATVLFREVCESLHVTLDAKNLLTDDGQRRLNDEFVHMNISCLFFIHVLLTLETIFMLIT